MVGDLAATAQGGESDGGHGGSTATMSDCITILGDGAMATVCAILANQKGHEVVMWGAFEESIDQLIQNRENRRFLPGVKVPKDVRLTASDKDCFENCSMVLSAVPTQYMREVWQRVGKNLPDGVPVVSVAKGIENNTLLRPTQIIADVLSTRGRRMGDDGPKCDWPLAVLSGPNIASELARYLPATSVVAAEDLELAKRVQAAFATEWLRIYTNDDVVGVELAGASKNVVAIAAGIIDGLAAGSNAKAALVTRGLVEITRLGMAMGAQEATFTGLAGLGDLITTCISGDSRNRRVGEQIGKGKKLADILSQMNSVAEGVSTTQSVRELGRRYGVEMPITEAVHSVLFEGKDVLKALSDLMSREPKGERVEM
jgi:glycerol-3-phosphate dehydrogenase (NAD(P)+)